MQWVPTCWNAVAQAQGQTRCLELHRMFDHNIHFRASRRGHGDRCRNTSDPRVVLHLTICIIDCFYCIQRRDRFGVRVVLPPAVASLPDIDKQCAFSTFTHVDRKPSNPQTPPSTPRKSDITTGLTSDSRLSVLSYTVPGVVANFDRELCLLAGDLPSR